MSEYEIQLEFMIAQRMELEKLKNGRKPK